MSVDYIVSSLPTLTFGAPAPISWEKFAATVGEAAERIPPEWQDLATQLRNAIAEARGGERWKRPAAGCSLYWKNRIAACFQERNVAKRDELIDRTWWDAAGELTSPISPLGAGAIATYAIRLRIAIRRAAISTENGNAAFDRLTSKTKLTI